MDIDIKPYRVGCVMFRRIYSSRYDSECMQFVQYAGNNASTPLTVNNIFFVNDRNFIHFKKYIEYLLVASPPFENSMFLGYEGESDVEYSAVKNEDGTINIGANGVHVYVDLTHQDVCALLESIKRNGI